MKRIIAVATGLLMLAPCPALAWGSRGHRIVADLAEARLTPRARQGAAALLALDHARRLSDISSWADDIHSQGKHGNPTHETRIRLKGAPNIAAACRRAYCAADAIDVYAAILADKRQPPAAREEALKYVVHLVGDVHQPLHDVAPAGSGVKVSFDGTDTTLHRVWDSGIIRDHGGDAGQIERQIAGLASPAAAGGTPRGWALEGRQVAIAQVYEDVPSHTKGRLTLSADYGRRKWPVVAQQLSMAGIRLARVLNTALN